MVRFSLIKLVVECYIAYCMLVNFCAEAMRKYLKKFDLFSNLHSAILLI